MLFFFFFNDPAPPEIYPLSLPAALPICLSPPPRRPPTGYRQYADDAVARLRFIKHAQELGFSLQEIQELLGLRVRHGAACDAVERKTRHKIEVVQQRIRALQRMKRTQRSPLWPP